MSEVKTVQGALVSEIRKSSAFNPDTQVRSEEHTSELQSH